MTRDDCCPGDPPGLVHSMDCPDYLASVAAFESLLRRVHNEDGVSWVEPDDGTCGFPSPFRQDAACPLPNDHHGPHAEETRS